MFLNISHTKAPWEVKVSQKATAAATDFKIKTVLWTEAFMKECVAFQARVLDSVYTRTLSGNIRGFTMPSLKKSQSHSKVVLVKFAVVSVPGL